MIFSALALAKILAFSEPSKFEGFNGVPKARTAIERLCELPGEGAGKPFLCYIPGLIPILVPDLGVISSVQKINITIAGSSASNTQTVTSVNTNTSLLVYGGQISSQTSSTDYTDDLGGLTLTSATVVTFARNDASATTTITGYATLVEFASAFVKSVQYGTIAITGAATSNTGSITSVVTTNSAVGYLGQKSVFTGVSRAVVAARLNLTSGTVVTATKNTGGGTSDTTVYYVVIEFQSGVLNSSTQEVSTTISTGATANSTVTGVTTGNSWMIYGGQSGAYSASANGQYPARHYLAGSTTVTADEGINNAVTIVSTLIEFKSADVLVSSQRGHADEIADNTTQKDTTITSVDVTKSFYQWLGGFQTTGSGANVSRVNSGGELQAATNVRQYLGPDTGTVGVTPSWEVISLRGS